MLLRCPSPSSEAAGSRALSQAADASFPTTEYACLDTLADFDRVCPAELGVWCDRFAGAASSVSGALRFAPTFVCMLSPQVFLQHLQVFSEETVPRQVERGLSSAVRLCRFRGLVHSVGFWLQSAPVSWSVHLRLTCSSDLCK